MDGLQHFQAGLQKILEQLHAGLKKNWWDHNWGWDQKHDWSQEKEAWGSDQKHDLHVWSQMEVASKELSARKRKAAADLINIDKAQRCLQEARDLMS